MCAESILGHHYSVLIKRVSLYYRWLCEGSTVIECIHELVLNPSESKAEQNEGHQGANSQRIAMCQVVDSIRVFKSKVNVIELSDAGMQTQLQV